MDTGNGERVRQDRRGIRDAAGTEKRMHAEHTQVALQLTYIHASPNQHLKEQPNTHMQVKAVTNTERTYTKTHSAFHHFSQLYDKSEKQTLYMCIFRYTCYQSMCVSVCVGEVSASSHPQAVCVLGPLLPSRH